jgi:GDP-L-fucose synthase
VRPLFPIDRASRVYVAGHRGLVGSAVWRHLGSEGFTNLVGRSSHELDLRDRKATFDFFADERPEIVVLAAARVGSILANSTYPSEFLSDNLRIQLSVMDAAREYGVARLLFLGSSCAYPKFAEQPIPEEALLTGPLEPTNDGYAIAKIAGVFQVQAFRRQYGLPYISVMPTNLYGPGDNFDPGVAHVVPALIRRYHDAALTKALSVTNWGSGTPMRELLHVDDLARACLFLLETYDDPTPINVGSGKDISIRELAEIVAAVVGFRGSVDWDTTKPDGTPRKLLDVSRLNKLGWQPTIGLSEGIESTYEWFLANQG